MCVRVCAATQTFALHDLGKAMPDAICVHKPRVLGIALPCSSIRALRNDSVFKNRLHSWFVGSTCMAYVLHRCNGTQCTLFHWYHVAPPPYEAACQVVRLHNDACSIHLNCMQACVSWQRSSALQTSVLAGEWGECVWPFTL